MDLLPPRAHRDSEMPSVQLRRLSAPGAGGALLSTTLCL